MTLATAKYDASKSDEAIAILHEAVELAEAVPTEDRLVRRQVYKTYHNLAEYYFETNLPQEAIRYCQRAIELSEAFQREDPNDLEWIRLGSYSRRLSGRVSFASEQWDDAVRHFEAVLAVRKDIAKREPHVPHRKLEVADAHSWIGKASRKNSQLDMAVRHHKAACTIFSDLLDTEPEMVEYTVRLTHADVHLASDYMSYKTSDGNELALEIFERARQRVTEDLNTTPGQRKRIVDLLAAIDNSVATLNRRRGNQS